MKYCNANSTNKTNFYWKYFCIGLPYICKLWNHNIWHKKFNIGIKLKKFYRAYGWKYFWEGLPHVLNLY